MIIAIHGCFIIESCITIRNRFPDQTIIVLTNDSIKEYDPALFEKHKLHLIDCLSDLKDHECDLIYLFTTKIPKYIRKCQRVYYPFKDNYKSLELFGYRQMITQDNLSIFIRCIISYQKMIEHARSLSENVFTDETGIFNNTKTIVDKSIIVTANQLPKYHNNGKFIELFSFGPHTMYMYKKLKTEPISLFTFGSEKEVRKLLWVSNMGFPCSYHHVSKSIIPHLSKSSKFDIYLFCIGVMPTHEYIEKVSKEYEVPLEKIYYLREPDISEEEYVSNYGYGIFSINNVCDMVDPDIIVSLNDTEPIKRQFNTLNSKYKPRFVPYMTLDCGDCDEEWIDVNYNRIITMTKFSKKEFEKVFFNRVDWIYHICDSKLFYKLPPQNTILTKKIIGIPDNKTFIVGSINANILRKRWDVLLEAFCMFNKNNPESFLLIKTDTISPEMVSSVVPNSRYDFKELVESIFKKHGIDLEGNVKIIQDINFTTEQLNEFYNCCDVGLVTTSGEGFGLSPCEMSLCKIPQIVPNYSSFTELFEGTSGLVEVEKQNMLIGRQASQVKHVCIFKTYPFHKNEIEIKEVGKMISFSSGIKTILISTEGESVKECAEKFNEFQLDNFDLFSLQIVIECNDKFIKKELDVLKEFNKYIYTGCEKRKYIFNTVLFNKLKESRGEVGIAKPEDVCKKLQLYHDNKDLRKKDGEICCKNILEKCNRNTIIKLFEKIL